MYRIHRLLLAIIALGLASIFPLRGFAQSTPSVPPLTSQELVRLVYELPKHPEKHDEIVEVIPSFEEFEGRTAALGRRHAGYGVRASHYELVRRALLAAIGNALGEDFTDATREAWVNAFGLVAESMQLGAAAQHRGHPRSE